MRNSLFQTPAKVWMTLLIAATVLMPPVVWALSVTDRGLFAMWTGWYWAVLTLRPGWWVGVLPFVFPALVAEIAWRVVNARRADAALARANRVVQRAVAREWLHEE